AIRIDAATPTDDVTASPQVAWASATNAGIARAEATAHDTAARRMTEASLGTDRDRPRTKPAKMPTPAATSPERYVTQRTAEPAIRAAGERPGPSKSSMSPSSTAASPSPTPKTNAPRIGWPSSDTTRQATT